MPSFIAATEPLSAAQTVKPEACSSFDAFLSVKKSMRSLLCQRRKKCAFLTEEKSTKRLIEATASNSHASAGKAYTHGSQQTEPRTYVRSPSFAVRKLCATGKPAPAGARRAPCERLPIRYLLKRRRLTDHASKASVNAVFYSRHRTAASRTNGQAVRLRLLFVLFFP